MCQPALFTTASRPPNAAPVFSTAPLMAPASAASAWIAIAFPPAPSMAFTTDAAASAPFEYVIATLAPSAARRFRDRCANAPRTAGNECHFLGQLRHGISLGFLGTIYHS